MKGWNLIYSILLILLFGACKQQEQPWEKEKNQATVTFTLSVPSEKDTRGNVSSYPKEPSKWTDAEKLADGRYLEDVTVMILDKNNTLLAREDVAVANMAEQTQVTFNTTFNTGSYTLMAVANYTKLTDFTSLLDDFKNGSKTYEDLLAYKLQAGDDGIAPQAMQPLTLIKNIELHPGQNDISGELLRTYARIRIEIRNQSATNDLQVNGISFSNNFAQKEASIWPGQGYFPNSREAMDVDSDDALTPFTQSVTISKMTTSGVTTTVNSAVVFDAYILESEEMDETVDYTYTLDLRYGNKSTTVADVVLTNVTDIKNNYENCYFLIQNTRTGKFMYDEGTNDSGRNLRQGSSLDNLKNKLQTNYLWKLIHVRDNQYQIMNVASKDFIGFAYHNSPVQFTDQANSATYTLSEKQNLLQLKNNDCFLDDYLNAGNYISGNKNGNYNGSRFRFYPTSEEDNAIVSHNVSIKLRTINKETAKVEAVRTIKRNDFINALVTVSYNETIGQFEFEVENWDQAGGDITYN